MWGEQLMFSIPRGLDKQVRCHNPATGQYEDVPEPWTLDRELMAMLLPAVIAVQVRFCLTC